MEQHDYHSNIVVETTAENAFKTIGRVSDWWATDIDGNTSALNDVFTVRFGTTRVTFSITEIIPSKKIVWLVTESHLPWLKNKSEWTGTRIVWEITPQEHGARVDMTHYGLHQGIECFENCKSGWDFYVKESLKQLMTQGKGQPNTPRDQR